MLKKLLSVWLFCFLLQFLLDSIIYFMGNIQGSVETYVVLWNNHMHATPYISAVNIGSLTSILFIDL